jgi:hypothetical protein
MFARVAQCVPNEQTSSTSKQISLHRASAAKGDIMITVLMKTVSVPQSVLRYDGKYWVLQYQNVPRADDSTRLYSAEAESSIANSVGVQMIRPYHCSSSHQMARA